MAKRDRAAESLNAIAALRGEPDVGTLTEALKPHLASNTGVVIEKVAGIVRERKIDTLGPELAAAFARLMPGGAKADPTNAAKFQVITAGVELGGLEAETYLAAIRHVQMEGSFGPPIDTARAMRGQAAFGLLNVKYRDALYEIAELLDDAERDGSITDARRGGIRALGTLAGESSALMLRLTARRYAKDPDTLAEVFASLNAIEAGKSFDFIAGFLDASDDVAAMAALAVAESRQPQAAEVLIAAWHANGRHASDPQAFLTALSMTRKPAAIDLLLDRLTDSPLPQAVAALEALRLHRADESLQSRIGQIVIARDDRILSESWQKRGQVG
jgi:hypothetical protein